MSSPTDTIENPDDQVAYHLSNRNHASLLIRFLGFTPSNDLQKVVTEVVAKLDQQHQTERADDFHGHFRHAKILYYVANGILSVAMVLSCLMLMLALELPAKVVGTTPVAGFNLGCIVAGCYWLACAEYVIRSASKTENVVWLKKARTISMPSRCISMLYFASVLIVNGFLILG